jgi:hypothetical protein
MNINKALCLKEDKLLSMEFVATRRTLEAQTFAKRIIHPDCLEIRFSSGDCVLQDATTTHSPIYVTSENERMYASLFGACNHVQSINDKISKIINWELDMDDNTCESLDVRYIPSYIVMIDSRINWRTTFITHMYERDPEYYKSRIEEYKLSVAKLEKMQCKLREISAWAARKHKFLRYKLNILSKRMIHILVVCMLHNLLSFVTQFEVTFGIDDAV